MPGLDISALDAKLSQVPFALENKSVPSLTQPRNLSPRSSRSVTPEYTNDIIQASVVAARDRLLALGGRPLRPLNFDPGPWDPSGTIREEHHIQNHWASRVKDMRARARSVGKIPRCSKGTSCTCTKVLRIRATRPTIPG